MNRCDVVSALPSASWCWWISQEIPSAFSAPTIPIALPVGIAQPSTWPWVWICNAGPLRQSFCTCSRRTPHARACPGVPVLDNCSEGGFQFVTVGAHVVFPIGLTHRTVIEEFRRNACLSARFSVLWSRVDLSHRQPDPRIVGVLVLCLTSALYGVNCS